MLCEEAPRSRPAPLRDGVVNKVEAYLAPMFVGTGGPAIGDIGTVSLGSARRWKTETVDRLGDDVLVTLTREVG